MMVCELIELLKNLPGHAIVLVDNEEWGVSEEYVGDPVYHLMKTNVDGGFVVCDKSEPGMDCVTL